MTPATILQFFTILIGGACFLGFLFVMLVLVHNLINAQINSKKSPDDIILTTEEKNKLYYEGIKRGADVVYVSLFKYWKDNNELPFIGSFDDLLKESSGVVAQFQTSSELFTTWVQTYAEYIKNKEK